MRALCRGQTLAGDRERFVPADRMPFGTDAPQRRAQPIRIGFQIEDRVALRADVAAAERIFGVAANRAERAVFVTQFQAADRFAQRTGAVVRGAGQGVLPMVCRTSANLVSRYFFLERTYNTRL